MVYQSFEMSWVSEFNAFKHFGIDVSISLYFRRDLLNLKTKSKDSKDIATCKLQQHYSSTSADFSSKSRVKCIVLRKHVQWTYLSFESDCFISSASTSTSGLLSSRKLKRPKVSKKSRFLSSISFNSSLVSFGKRKLRLSLPGSIRIHSF